MYSLTVLGAEHLQSRGWQAHAPAEAFREGPPACQLLALPDVP